MEPNSLIFNLDGSCSAIWLEAETEEHIGPVFPKSGMTTEVTTSTSNAPPQLPVATAGSSVVVPAAMHHASHSSTVWFEDPVGLTVNSVQDIVDYYWYDDGHMSPIRAYDIKHYLSQSGWTQYYTSLYNAYDPECVSYTASTTATFQNPIFCSLIPPITSRYTAAYYAPNSIVAFVGNYEVTYDVWLEGQCTSLLTLYASDW
jgi:hypothetical protein